MSIGRRRWGADAPMSGHVSEIDAAGETPTRMAEHIVEGPGKKGRALTDDSSDARAASKEPTSDSPLFFVHPIELTFYNLAAKSEAHVRLDSAGTAKWGNGVPGNQLVGVSLSSSPRATLLALNAFLINYRNVSLFTNAACAEIHARLYVHALERSFSGRVDLPPGAVVTIESPVDRTTLAEHGLSSYTLALR